MQAMRRSQRSLARGDERNQGGTMIARRPFRKAAWGPLAVLAAVFAVAVGAIPSASAASSSGTVKPPEGAVAPQPGTGMGTAAAMKNPLCNTDPRFGPYGRWNSGLVGGGPVCVVPMKAGAKNSGASARGVTKDSIKVVFLQPSDVAQSALSQSTAGNPVNLNGNTKGVYEDGAHDFLASALPHYETWGRDIDVVNYKSTGNDEASQRADALAVLAMKPFAVINVDSSGLDVFEAAVAKGKTLVFGYGTSPEEADAQAPYRWGAQDNRVAGLISAELVGKQLAGGKAEFAGDALKTTPRKFGMVNVDAFEPTDFTKEAAKYKVKLADSEEYPGTGAPQGDATISAQQAPTIVGKLKAAGVTTVIDFADQQMNIALTKEATKQEWYPEWVIAGYPQYADLASTARAYDRGQVNQMFGLSVFQPFVATTPEQQTLAATGNYAWLWGPQAGTTSPRTALGTAWLLNGIHAAGPKLTVKSFQQGLFSLPSTGGSGTNNPLVGKSGYGRTPGLPYDSYTNGALDYALVWLDPTHDAQLAATLTIPGQASWYIDGGKKFGYGAIPTKPVGFFDQTKSVLKLDAYPSTVQAPTAGPPCPAGACPITGASAPQPGSPGTDYTLQGWNGTKPNSA